MTMTTTIPCIQIMASSDAGYTAGDMHALPYASRPSHYTSHAPGHYGVHRLYTVARSGGYVVRASVRVTITNDFCGAIDIASARMESLNSDWDMTMYRDLRNGRSQLDADTIALLPEFDSPNKAKRAAWESLASGVVEYALERCRLGIRACDALSEEDDGYYDDDTDEIYPEYGIERLVHTICELRETQGVLRDVGCLRAHYDDGDEGSIHASHGLIRLSRSWQRELQKPDLNEQRFVNANTGNPVAMYTIVLAQLAEGYYPGDNSWCEEFEEDIELQDYLPVIARGEHYSSDLLQASIQFAPMCMWSCG